MFGFMAGQRFFNIPIINNYVANNAAVFDGVNDGLSIPTTVLPAMNAITVSMWYKGNVLTGADAMFGWYNGGASKQFYIYFIAPNSQIAIRHDGTATTSFNRFYANLHQYDGQWHHLLVSLNGTTPEIKVARDGVIIPPNFLEDGVTPAGVNNNWSFDTNYGSGNQLQIGNRNVSPGPYDGEMQEVWFNNEYLDLDNPANIAKFIKDGKPVNLGADGSLPTGNQPLIYLKNSYTTFQNNLGTVGDLTVIGALQEGTVPNSNTYFAEKAAVFDGVNDYIHVNTTSNPTRTKTGTISCWVKVISTPTTTGQILYGTSSSTSQTNVGPLLRIRTSIGDKVNTIRFASREVDGSEYRFIVNADNNAFTLGEWLHYMLSFDVSTGNVHLYINGVDKGVVENIEDYLIDWDPPTFRIGQTANIELQEFYMHNEYIDLSVQSNREKFYKDGNPVYLGDTGSLPTGTQPLVYLKDPFSTFQNNLGSLGNFTVTGALTEGTKPDNIYVANTAPLLDGVNDYLSNLSFNVTGQPTMTSDALISFWIYPLSDPKTTNALYFPLNWEEPGIAFWLNYRNWTSTNSTNVMRIAWRDVESWTDPVTTLSTNDAVNSGSWHHVAISFSVSGGFNQIYVNGVDRTNASGTRAPKPVFWNRSDFAIAARITGEGFIHGYMQEIIFHNKSLDLSVEANRNKLITNTGSKLIPANVGINGQKIFGETPHVYVNNLYDTFGVNKGTGGNFTVNGALENSALKPEIIL